MDQFNEILGKVIKESESDLYMFVATVNDENADKFIKIIREQQNRKENCSLILTTYGGDPDAGYRIVRTIKRYYSKFTLYIFGSCKSTGTLMALGADEIVMSDFGEFGPLDIQLTRDDELSNTSGLNFVQSLMSLNEQLFRAFEENFLGLKRRSRNTITTRTAAEICSKLAVGLISPISAQIDPVKLGEVQRSIKIANEYGTRLSNKGPLIAKLIVGYPSHGFVIDFKEAQEIFGKCVRWVGNNESILEQLLHNIVRNESDKEDFIEILIPESQESENISGEVNSALEDSELIPTDIENQPVVANTEGQINNKHGNQKKSDIAIKLESNGSQSKVVKYRKNNRNDKY